MEDNANKIRRFCEIQNKKETVEEQWRCLTSPISLFILLCNFVNLGIVIFVRKEKKN